VKVYTKISLPEDKKALDKNQSSSEEQKYDLPLKKIKKKGRRKVRRKKTQIESVPVFKEENDDTLPVI
jgi:ATP-dependent helicase YprA (DUF1998 family)